VATEVLPSIHLPGPLSNPELEDKHPDLFARLISQSQQYLPYRDTTEHNPKGIKIQCQGARENHHLQEEFMSQGPATKSRTSSTSPHEERHKRLPPLGSRALPPIQSANSALASYDLGSNAPSAQNGTARQPPQRSGTPDQRSSRPSGFQNLLNPTSNGNTTETQNKRRSGDHSVSPPGATAVPRMGTPSLPAPSMMGRSPVRVSLPSITPPSANAYPQSLGRSPSVYAPSPVTMNGPSGTIDAKQSPFVLPRDHNMNGMPGAVGLPELNRVPSIPGEPSQSPPGRRSSQDSTRYDRMQLLVGRPGRVGNGPHAAASLSDSPSTQYSGYSQVSRQTPPAQSNVPRGEPQSFFTTPFNAGDPASTMAQMTFDVPASSSATGASTYQMMTLDTESGPIQVPVDVQAASKVADEKRKRNATASHRFRQRRKEKERETSQNISKLESQIREMEEERDFYRGERDYFRNLTSRVPGQGHHLPRPVSPRQRRHASMGGSMGYGNVQFQGPENGNSNGSRNTRRRTSSYVPPSGPHPQAEIPVPVPQYQQAPPNHIGGHRGRP